MHRFRAAHRNAVPFHGTALCVTLAGFAGVVVLGAASLAHAQFPEPTRESLIDRRDTLASLPDGPTHTLEQVGAWGGACNTFEKVGNLGYLGSGERLVILDVGDPNNFIELGAVRMRGLVYDVAVQGAITPTSSQPATWDPYIDPEFPPELEIRSTFHAVDISDPSNPTVVWSDRYECQTLVFGSYDISLWGQFAYIHAGGLIEVFDLSDPASPKPIVDPALNCPWDRHIINSLDLSGNYDPQNIEVRDGLLYVAAEDFTQFEKLLIFDLTSIDTQTRPTSQATRWAPTLIGSVVLPEFFEWDGGARFALDGQSLYAVFNRENRGGNQDEDFSRLWGIDVSDPQNPVLGGYHDFEVAGLENQVFNNFTNSVSVNNGQVCVSSGVNEFSPGMFATWGFVESIYVFDTTGVHSNPTLAGTYKTHGSPIGVTFENGIAYLRDKGEGLIALDVSLPSAVSRLDNYHSPARLMHSAKRGNLLFVSDAWNGLSILDVTDPAHPTLVGVYQAEWGAGFHNGTVALDEQWVRVPCRGVRGARDRRCLRSGQPVPCEPA